MRVGFFLWGSWIAFEYVFDENASSLWEVDLVLVYKYSEHIIAFWLESKKHTKLTNICSPSAQLYANSITTRGKLFLLIPPEVPENTS